VGDIFTVFDDDVVNCFPVVGAVANWSGVVDEERKELLGDHL
jgi:hypothetical protein